MKKEIVADENLVAFCGLYCGACPRYTGGKCPGCKENVKAAWCGVRKCCLEHNFGSCADCVQFQDQRQCKKFNNFMSKIFGFIFKSNRKACIDRIREIGKIEFAKEMTAKKTHSIKK